MQYSSDRANLKTIDPACIPACFLGEDGREGVFIWRDGDYTAKVASDPFEGIYIEADCIAASSGAWVRSGGWNVEGKSARWFGVRASETPANNRARLQSVVDMRGTVIIPDDEGGDYGVSDTVLVRSRTTIRWTGNSFIKLMQPSTIGQVVAAYHEGPVGDNQGRSVDVFFDNPLIDGGNLGHLAGAPYGENGIGGAFVNRLRIRGGVVKNCRHGASERIGTGGKGIQVECSVSDCVVDGTFVLDCTIGAETGGTASGGAGNITFRNLNMLRCDVMVSLMQTYSPMDTAVSTNSCVVENVAGYNCGRESAGASEATRQSFGAICVDRYANAVIRNVVLHNDPSYGRLGALVRLYCGYNVKVDVKFNGDAKALVDNKNVSPGFGVTDIRTLCQFDIHHRGGDADYAVVGGPISPVACEYNIRTSSISAALFDAASAKSGNYARFYHLLNTQLIEGRMDRLWTQYSGGYGTVQKTEMGLTSARFL